MTLFKRINQPLSPRAKAAVIVGFTIFMAVGAVLDNRRGPPTTAAADIRSTAQKKADETKAIARYGCRMAVEYSAKFPSKVKWPWFDYGKATIGLDPGHVIVAGRVELMNGMGAMIPHRYRCEFKADKLTHLQISAGG